MLGDTKYANKKVQLKALRKTLLCGLDVPVNGSVHVLLYGAGLFIDDNSFFLLHEICFCTGNMLWTSI